MYKLIGLAKRKANWTHKQYSEYYRTQHGPLFMSVTDCFQYVQKYVQCHPVAGMPDGGYDSVAELYFTSIEDIGKAFSSPRYLEIIRPDELHFCDLDSARFLITRETQVVAASGDPGGYQMLRFLRRRAGMDRKEFRRRWHKATAEIAAAPKLGRYIGRYLLDDVAVDSDDPLNSGSEGSLDYDGCVSLWLRDPADWTRLCADEDWKRYVGDLESEFTEPGTTFEVFGSEYKLFEAPGFR